MNSSYLVQRLQERQDNSSEKKGIDKYFSMDYMGSSEFEWGALPKSLKEIRNRLDHILVEQITCGKHTCFFVGTKKQISTAKELFTDQIGEMKIHLKESTYIDYAYGTSDTNLFASLGKSTVGWWDVVNHFFLFKTKQLADQCVTGLKNKKD